MDRQLREDVKEEDPDWARGLGEQVDVRVKHGSSWLV